MTVFIPKAQVGKSGITPNFLKTLKTYFVNHKNVKVSVLKSGLDVEDKKEKMREYEKKILNSLGKMYTSRTIGHTIVVKKWRRAMSI